MPSGTASRRLVQISEVRTIAPDGLWMSTAFGRASAAIHFTWQPDWEAVRRVLPAIEDALAPFEPRPHWGKLFTMSPDAVRSTYDELPRFAELLQRHDPLGKFRNAFLDRYIFAAGPPNRTYQYHQGIEQDPSET